MKTVNGNAIVKNLYLSSAVLSSIELPDQLSDIGGGQQIMSNVEQLISLSSHIDVNVNTTGNYSTEIATVEVVDPIQKTTTTTAIKAPDVTVTSLTSGIPIATVKVEGKEDVTVYAPNQQGSIVTAEAYEVADAIDIAKITIDDVEHTIKAPKKTVVSVSDPIAGEKIATITVDEATYEIKAPKKTSVSVSDTIAGEKIATITVDDKSYDINAKEATKVTVTPETVEDPVKIATVKIDDGADIILNAPKKTSVSVEAKGEGTEEIATITVDSNTPVSIKAPKKTVVSVSDPKSEYSDTIATITVDGTPYLINAKEATKVEVTAESVADPVKIATVKVDSTSYEIQAPKKTMVSVSDPIEGEEIATITVDNTSYAINAPKKTTVVVTPETIADPIKIATVKIDNGDDIVLNAPKKTAVSVSEPIEGEKIATITVDEATYEIKAPKKTVVSVKDTQPGYTDKIATITIDGDETSINAKDYTEQINGITSDINILQANVSYLQAVSANTQIEITCDIEPTAQGAYKLATLKVTDPQSTEKSFEKDIYAVGAANQLQSVAFDSSDRTLTIADNITSVTCTLPKYTTEDEVSSMISTLSGTVHLSGDIKGMDPITVDRIDDKYLIGCRGCNPESILSNITLNEANHITISKMGNAEWTIGDNVPNYYGEHYIKIDDKPQYGGDKDICCLLEHGRNIEFNKYGDMYYVELSTDISLQSISALSGHYDWLSVSQEYVSSLTATTIEANEITATSISSTYLYVDDWTIADLTATNICALANFYAPGIIAGINNGITITTTIYAYGQTINAGNINAGGASIGNLAVDSTGLTSTNAQTTNLTTDNLTVQTAFAYNGQSWLQSAQGFAAGSGESQSVLDSISLATSNVTTNNLTTNGTVTHNGTSPIQSNAGFKSGDFTFDKTNGVSVNKVYTSELTVSNNYIIVGNKRYEEKQIQVYDGSYVTVLAYVGSV